MHGVGAAGQLAPQGNLQYLLSQPGQLSDTIRMFQSMLDNLDKMQAALTKARPMSAGGVVTNPTMALVGEAGPEAVIPLERLQGMFGDPAKMFTRNNTGTLAQQWLTADGWATSTRCLVAPAKCLPGSLDLGNSGAASMLDRWNQMQDAAVQAIESMSQRRRIELAPTSSVLSNQNTTTAMRTATTALHFNFGDIHVTGGMTQQEIGSLFDRIENEARSRGYDLTGRPPSVARPKLPVGH